MTKIKFPYYLFWKSMRAVADKVRRSSDINYSSLWNALSNYFYTWLHKQDAETLGKDIISLRDMFEESQKKLK